MPTVSLPRVTTFVPAGDLSEAFHAEVIRPLIGDIPYAAGLLGWGSDVLGYDTERSTDHGWGPRLTVFVDAEHVEPVRKAIEHGLPDTFHGYDVRFGWDTQEPIHHVNVSTLADWLVGHLGIDATRPLTKRQWLTLPQQQILGVVKGRVFADDGRLRPVRERLQWYPDDVWRWLSAAQWRRIAQEEPFVQRTAEVGDDLGSAVVAARQIREVMRLALLQARAYAPYGKWFGTAFAGLGHADGLDVVLREALRKPETALPAAYELVAGRHNALGITGPVDPAPRRFHERPAMVLDADRFVTACLDTIEDPWLKGLPLIGAVDQFGDSTDLLSRPTTYTRLTELYGEEQ